MAGRPYCLKAFCLIWVLNLLTFCYEPWFCMAGRPQYVKVCCLIWGLNLLTFGYELWFVYSRSSLLLQGFLLNLGAKCSFQTCCELIYITTFQEEYLKIAPRGSH